MSKAPAVDYALRIIEYFSKCNCPLGITDISDALHINKNAVSRILESLIEYGWIYCNDMAKKKYVLSMKPFSIVSKCVNENLLVKTAEPFVKNLHAQLGDSTYFAIRKENKALYLLHYDSIKSVRISGCVGGEYPIEVAAPGKVLLAWSGKVAPEFEKEAEMIRDRGYAIDNEEFGKGIICYACPVFNADGDVVASIGISSLTIYDSIDSLINEKGKFIYKCAKEVSEALGYFDNSK